MSARAWQARKPGPYHLTGKQKREIVGRQREMRAVRRRLLAKFVAVNEAMRSLGVAASDASRAFDACQRSGQ